MGVFPGESSYAFQRCDPWSSSLPPSHAHTTSTFLGHPLPPTSPGPLPTALHVMTLERLVTPGLGQASLLCIPMALAPRP